MASHAALRVRRHPRRAVALAAVTATLCATGVTAAFASASPSAAGSGGTVRLIVQTAKGLSATQRSAVVGRNGGTHKRDITDLRAQVIDRGRGFDAERLGHAEADPSAEEGRGIQLIRALVDKVHFRSRAESGTIVHLEKELQYVE